MLCWFSFGFEFCFDFVLVWIVVGFRFVLVFVVWFVGVRVCGFWCLLIVGGFMAFVV